MSKSKDRRTVQMPVNVDRRVGQRRKNETVRAGDPVRRKEDWDHIESELNKGD